MKSMKAPSKPETKQAPEWAMRAAKELWQYYLSGHTLGTTEDSARIISQHLDPAVNELVEAAREVNNQIAYYRREVVDGNGVHADLGNAGSVRLQSALKPFGGE